MPATVLHFPTHRANPLPTLAALASRRDPQAALRAKAERWAAAAARHASRGERTLAAKAERMAAGYRAQLAAPEGD